MKARAAKIGNIDMPRIDVGSIALNYTQVGDGEPLLFIPGLVGLFNAWDYQLEHFAEHYRCISFDHRGAGDSDKPRGGEHYSTEHLASDAIGLLDTLGIERAHVIGTSTGGCVVQNLAIDCPHRLGACVFSNTWTKADIYFRRLQTYRKWIAESHGQEAYVEFSSILTNGTQQFRYDLDKVMALEERAKRTIAPIEIIAARIDMTLTHDRCDEIGQIDRPSLIIGTTDDATVPVYFSLDLHEAIKGSELHIFEQGGHYSYRRHFGEWNALVKRFLEEHSL
jgi:pimeloyl-ACP methyl ester carboxylesterase